MVTLPDTTFFWRPRGADDNSWTEAPTGSFDPTDGSEVEVVSVGASEPSFITADTDISVSGLTDLTVSYGEAVSIDATQAFSGTNLVYSIVSGPAWLSINPATGAITGTAPGSDVSVSVTVRASNNAGSVTDTLTVTVDSSMFSISTNIPGVSLSAIRSGSNWDVTVSGDVDYAGVYSVAVAEIDAGLPVCLVPCPDVVESPSLTFTAKPGLWISPTDDPLTVDKEWLDGGVATGQVDGDYTASVAYSQVLYRERGNNNASGVEPVVVDTIVRAAAAPSGLAGFASTWSDADYDYYVFTSSGTLSATTGGGAEAEIIAAGGGAMTANSYGTGGAGAGERVVSQITIEPGSNPITVGVGGIGGRDKPSVEQPLAGGDSTAFGITAIGGGIGSYVNATLDGGCGAGGWSSGSSATNPGGSGGLGGSGGSGLSGDAHRGGGGGGMGGPGDDAASSGTVGAAGGPGVSAWDGATVCAGGDGGARGAVASPTGSMVAGADGVNPGDGGSSSFSVGTPDVYGGSGHDGMVTIRIPK